MSRKLRLPKNTFVNDARHVLSGWTLSRRTFTPPTETGETLSVKMLADEAGKTWESGGHYAYAVWDQFPVIDAQIGSLPPSRWRGMASEEETVGTAEASDREDGRLEPGIGLVLLNFLRGSS